MGARRLLLAAVSLVAVVMCAGCSAASVPQPPAAVGENYPGTCLPAELSWPSDFIESLPGESPAVAGRIVGLRLEYVDSGWVWRLRSEASRTDAFGEQVDDASFGRESIVDVRTLQVIASHDTELTEAEQQVGTDAYDVVQQSGEQWPSPLVIELARVVEDGQSVWRVTTCDTETSEHVVQTMP